MIVRTTHRKLTANSVPDDLILHFVLDSFLRSKRPESPYEHLRHCRPTYAYSPVIEGAHTCGDGTCDYDPEVTAFLTCPHQLGRGLPWEVSAPTMRALLDRLAAFRAAQDA